MISQDCNKNESKGISRGALKGKRFEIRTCDVPKAYMRTVPTQTFKLSEFLTTVDYFRPDFSKNFLPRLAFREARNFCKT